MATYTAQEAIDLLESSFSDLLDSKGEEEIEEDPSFPLGQTLTVKMKKAQPL